jgi:hypothetical protein
MALMRQLLLPSPPPDALPTYALRKVDENWYAMRSADVVAMDDLCSEDLIVLRRDRRLFVRLLVRGVGTVLRLLLTHRRTVRRWKAEAPRLTKVSFWRRYLGLATPASPSSTQTASHPGDAA